jgi:hypothetical protein
VVVTIIVDEGLLLVAREHSVGDQHSV